MTGNVEYDAAGNVARRNVSAQEELLYGPYAAAVRRAGDLAVDARRVLDELGALFADSSSADQATSGVVGAEGYDDRGRSQHTNWLDTLGNRAWEVSQQCETLHADMARECMGRWADTRQGDGTPA